MVRKSLVSSLLAASLTFAPAIALAGEGAECQQAQMSAQAVVDKHLKALGGRERLKAVKTLQVTSISKEGNTLTRMSMQRARPNLMRYDKEKDGVTSSKAFDGTQGWSAEGSAAPQPVGKEKSAMMAEGAAFDDALLDPKARGTTLALDGVEEVNGAPAFKLVLTRGANKETRFIDQKSFLEVKRTSAGIHEGKAYNKTLSFSDYRSVDGIMMSHRVQWEGDGSKGEKVIQSARYDAPIDAATFKLATPRS
ncbi:hypothetical protein HPC49_02280 [Pyxidicoccus fallax]|uniref:Outer membrane lipoprotein-sorting protein n=1 Tax=Pyxidicoccus fallax TaxID=394095 RepID=A0A848LEA7_9BACT|nr:hypothetical protein [Pyxidicoccus fallax]NMO14561.1 hypothetical protein [Pyxidicoccus fallax]NPC77080.1 hypothetical protein [Pyxidicoccus fallax]